MDQNNNRNGQREALDWQRVKVCRHEESSLCVAVTAATIRGQRIFSFQIGRLVEEGPVDGNGVLSGKIVNHFRIMRNRDTVSEVSFMHDYEVVIGKLMQEALAWTQSEMGVDLMAELDRRRQREERDAGRNKHQTRQTGKTERERAKDA